MVGGNIPGVTRTVSIDIYDKVQAVNYSGANATALVLLAISFVDVVGGVRIEPASVDMEANAITTKDTKYHEGRLERDIGNSWDSFVVLRVLRGDRF